VRAQIPLCFPEMLPDKKAGYVRSLVSGKLTARLLLLRAHELGEGGEGVIAHVEGKSDEDSALRTLGAGVRDLLETGALQASPARAAEMGMDEAVLAGIIADGGEEANPSLVAQFLAYVTDLLDAREPGAAAAEALRAEEAATADVAGRGAEDTDAAQPGTEAAQPGTAGGAEGDGGEAAASGGAAAADLPPIPVASGDWLAYPGRAVDGDGAHIPLRMAGSLGNGLEAVANVAAAWQLLVPSEAGAADGTRDRPEGPGLVKHTLAGHSGWVISVAYAPSGLQLASGSYDTTVIIWNAATGAVLRTLTGHSGWVWSVAYAPSGLQLASGSADWTVIIWEAATGAALRTLTGHSGAVYSVAYAPAGGQLASGSGDKT